MKNIVFLISLFLVGCSGESEQTNKVEIKQSNNIEESENKEEGINNLKVDKSFDFTTDIKVQIEIEEDFIKDNAFLNICKEEQKLINNDNCFMRTNITKKGLKKEIVIPHKKQKLRAEIWFYNINKEPVIKKWSLNEEEENQIWKFKKN